MGVVTGSSGGGAAVDFLAKVQLSSAQILALGTTPVTVIAAPGSGKMVFPLAMVASLHFGTVAYDTSTSLEVTPVGDTSDYFVSLSNAFGHTEDKIATNGSGEATNTVARSVYENRAFILTTKNGVNPATGDGTCTVSVLYTVITLD